MTTVSPHLETLVPAASRRYDLDLHVHGDLSGGTESRTTLVSAGGQRFVLRASPPWRTLAELTWAFDLASYAAKHIAEVLAPVRTYEGSVAFEHEARVISLFPWPASIGLPHPRPHTGTCTAAI